MNNINLQNHLIKFSTILFCLIPIALITGPFIPDLFLVLIIFSSFGVLFLKKDFSIFKNKFFYAFVVFWLILTINSFFTFNFSSIKSASLYFRFFLFGIVIFLLISYNKNILENLFKIFLIIFLVLFFDSLYQFIFSTNLIGFVYDNPQNFRITSFFGEDEVLGSYISRFLPILIFLIVNSQNNLIKRYKLTLIFFYLIASFIIVILSGERTSIALFFLFTLFLLFSSINLRKLIIFPILLSLLIGGSLIYFNETLKNRIISSTLNQLGVYEGSERLVLFSKTYEGHYKIALNMFKEKPIFGHGAKMFRFYCSKEKNITKELIDVNACTTHPHNFYAQFLSETGLVGTSILMFVFIYILKEFCLNLLHQIRYGKQKLSDEAICILSVFFITFFPFLPSGNFFNNWLSIIIYYPMGFLLYLIKYKKYNV